MNLPVSFVWKSLILKENQVKNMRIVPLLVNVLWFVLSIPAAVKHYWACGNTEKTQRSLLLKIIRENKNTWYGQKCDFSQIKSYEKFRKNVPIISYADIEPMIERIAQGEADVLTRGLPWCFEPTSGSSSKSKLIPYTPALQRDFQNGISAWIVNMFLYHPSLVTGRSYWSISPAMDSTKLFQGATSVPVGFESDFSYLHPTIGKYYASCVAVPLEVSKLKDRDAFQYCTAAFLLAAGDLRFISVWNPTFLLLIISALENNWNQIAEDLDSGVISLPSDVPTPLAFMLKSKWSKDSNRASEVRRYLSEDFKKGLPKLWKHLAVISCWADVAAAGPAEEVKSFFPASKVIPKGLLATEGFVSLPIEPYSFPLLSITSHFFEFVSSDNKVSPSWALQKGERYSLLLTTGGGLYRYRLQDMVEITGYAKSCPFIRFVGRARVSDLFGEKLHESHIEEIIKEIFDDQLPFAFLAPSAISNGTSYILYMSSMQELSPDIRIRIRTQLEGKLSKNPHYQYCRQLGQLNHAEIKILPMTFQEASSCYLEVCSALNPTIKIGDIKPSFLEKPLNWYEKMMEAKGF